MPHVLRRPAALRRAAAKGWAAALLLTATVERDVRHGDTRSEEAGDGQGAECLGSCVGRCEENCFLPVA